MDLMPDKIKEKLMQYPIGSQDGKGLDANVIVKYFNPTGAGTWFILEGEQLENNDYILYGYCHLGDDNCAEFGEVLLSELQSIKLPFGMSIERDLYLKDDCTLKEAMELTSIKIPDYLLDEEEEI